jgi:hypothetical protein
MGIAGEKGGEYAESADTVLLQKPECRKQAFAVMEAET